MPPLVDTSFTLGMPSEGSSTSRSDVGLRLRDLLARSTGHLRGSWTLGEGWRATQTELADLAKECSVPNWDGYNAIAVSPRAFEFALKFLNALPVDLPQPEISASPQGDITFEWAQSPRRIVSVAISENGDLNYASLDGRRRNYGSLPYRDVFDPQLYALLHRVLG